MQDVKFIIDYLIKNLEVIKNILLSLFSAVASIVLAIFYIKVFLNSRKIKEVNKKIEELHQELGQIEIDNTRGVDEMKFKLDFGDEARSKKRLEKEIQKLDREKNNLLEEISIFTIFKK